MKNMNIFACIKILFIALAFALSEKASAQESQSPIKANEKWIVISDIDDTIKNTYSRARFNFGYFGYLLSAQAILQHPMSMNGMPELYQHLNRHLGLKFFYVTNFPYAHYNNLTADFLKYSGFPQGPYYNPAPDVSRKEFKLQIISEIIETEKPDGVIMIGDNSDADGMSYFWVADKFQDIKTITFIKQSNSTKYNKRFPGDEVLSLFPQQKGYVTSVDLAAELALMGFLNTDFLFDMNKIFFENFYNEVNYFREPNLSYKPISFPPWIDCQDYKPNAESLARYAFLHKYYKTLQQKCTPPKPANPNKMLYTK
jgi:hypothetical protein